MLLYISAVPLTFSNPKATQITTMRKPTKLECAYIDFDGFFASVEEQARPALRGKAIGVTPFSDTVHTCIIAANARAKKYGVKTGMSIREAQIKCPDLILQPQSPDLYVRAHRKLMLEIESVCPIDAVCSIDELTCRLDKTLQENPERLSKDVKARIFETVGPYITCSVGIAPNRLLAKIASDMDKPNGLTIFRPEALPGKLLDLNIDDIPGIGTRMRTRLNMAGIASMDQLWDSSPKHLRNIWRSVNGERFWYALHGYAIQADPTKRRMYGHGRVLPPEWRDMGHARLCARLLTTKAARRLRRSQYRASTFGLWLSGKDDQWSGELRMNQVNDDKLCLTTLENLWKGAVKDLPKNVKIIRVHVALYDLTRADTLQLDMFSDNEEREKWASVTHAMDTLNNRYARTILSLGPWVQPPGGYAGGKIAYARVPDMEDFW